MTEGAPDFILFHQESIRSKGQDAIVSEAFDGKT